MDEISDVGSRPSVGEYLIQKIYETGARHVFGVPGDYVLNFYAMLTRGPLQVINTCDEQGAGFAADAYARIHGLGVVCVTYNVGGFKVVNTTAEAYAEKSPVLVIAGAPGWQERKKYGLLHHKVREYNDQYNIFERITVASTELRDPAYAYTEIDRVLADIIHQKGPGYIELPRDIVNRVPGYNVDSITTPLTRKSHEKIPSEVLDQIVTRVNGSSRPVIWAGEEIARNNLGHDVLAFAEKANIPIVSTMLGKSAIDETSSLYLGVYAGVIEDQQVREYVEASDCLLLLGVILNDVNLGANTAILDPDRMITLSGNGCSIGTQTLNGAGLNAIPDLCGKTFLRHDLSQAPPARKKRTPTYVPTGAKITAARLFPAINSFMDESMVLIADVGDAAMGCMGITIPKPLHFLCPIYYSSLGFSVPAAIGVKAARPDLRPLVVVGDGAFQMTGMEISTAARYQMDPIVIVLNNGGYGTERPMIDGPFNDVAPWQYHRIPDIIGKGRGYLVTTEDELAGALAEAKESKDPSIIEVILDPYDITPQLRRMCERLAKGVKRQE
ncbi:MAG: thiamine pyrophosphate-binding protein [Methanomicrobiales archaeon]|nr:thiamine pyrophosphate-binding protein [Methanomicrobiales archaeon]